MTATDRKKWFEDRIGKIVYRNKTSCDCNTCNKIRKYGLKIEDSEHAGYLYDVFSESNLEGFPLEYFDTMQEVELFEKEHNII